MKVKHIIRASKIVSFAIAAIISFPIIALIYIPKCTISIFRGWYKQNFKLDTKQKKEKDNYETKKK